MLAGARESPSSWHADPLLELPTCCLRPSHGRCLASPSALTSTGWTTNPFRCQTLSGVRATSSAPDSTSWTSEPPRRRRCSGGTPSRAAARGTKRCRGAALMTVVLAIETSCDETGVGIARLDADGTVTLLADEVASSVDEHVRFGGVVPEIASRAHLEALGPAMRRALATAGVQQPDIIAATIGPGLAGALLVGVAAAKGDSASREVPVYAGKH